MDIHYSGLTCIVHVYINLLLTYLSACCACESPLVWWKKEHGVSLSKPLNSTQTHNDILLKWTWNAAIRVCLTRTHDDYGVPIQNRASLHRLDTVVDSGHLMQNTVIQTLAVQSPAVCRSRCTSLSC